MNRVQTWLQQTLKQLDPWLDAVFPIATALICARERLAGYSLLTLYLLLRLLQRSEREPWRWILISLLIVNAGLIIEDRDVKPGSPSDYLIVALSFAAGFQRTQQQWRRSLAWMASCIIPLLGFSLAAGDALAQGNSSFTGFNINKIGFLAGLMSIFSYGLLMESKQQTSRFIATALLCASMWSSLLSGSRASIATPAIAIIIDQLIRAKWNTKRLLVAAGALLLIATGTTYTWYGGSDKHGNGLSDLNRIETIECWLDTTISTKNGLLTGLGFNRSAQELCGPERIQSLRKMGKEHGLQHAHNFYAQIFSETGLPGLLLASGATLAAFRRALTRKKRSEERHTAPLVIYLFLMALGITYWQVMMINQVLVGFSLAALSAKEPDPSTEA